MKVLGLAALLSLMSANAFAADLPSRRAPPAPPGLFTPQPVFSWTGFYAGVNAGYAFDGDAAYSTGGNTLLNGTAIALGERPGFVKTRADGFTGGGQIGYNYAFSNGLGFGGLGGGLVAGVEADAAYTDLRADSLFVGTNGSFVTYQSRTDFVGTVRGRLGLAFGQLLVFGTGGFAYGGVRDGSNYFTPAGIENYSNATNTIKAGYAYGGGVEYAIPTSSFLNVFRSSAVTLKAEYIHYDLGNSLLYYANLFGSVNSYSQRIHDSGNLVRAGINYKFDLGAGPAPVVARY